MQFRDGGPADFSYSFTCANKRCKAKATAQVEDVNVYYSGVNYGGDSKTREYGVECQRCGHINDLPRTIPAKVRAAADERERRGGSK